MEFIFKYWIELFFGLLISIVGYLYKKIVDYKKIITATRNGVQALLKAKIIEKYNDYNIIGKMSIYDRETVNLLYREYKTLGGNGVIDKLFEDLQRIPTINKKGGDEDGKCIS